MACAALGAASNVTVILVLLADAALATSNGERPMKFALATVSASASLARVTAEQITVYFEQAGYRTLDLGLLEERALLEHDFATTG